MFKGIQQYCIQTSTSCKPKLPCRVKYAAKIHYYNRCLINYFKNENNEYAKKKQKNIKGQTKITCVQNNSYSQCMEDNIID